MFRLPTFNVLADIYSATPTGAIGPLRHAAVPCQVYSGRGAVITELRFPAHTDVRQDGGFPPYGDYVEAPAGSGVIYRTAAVSDRAVGFANQYRIAWAYLATPPTTFPIP